MRRGAWLGLLAAAVLVAMALWALRGRERDRALRAATPAEHDGASLGARGGGGVRAGEVDQDASIVVRGEVLDVDGVPVTDGALLLRCLRGDAVHSLGAIRLSEEGTFEGPGCRGRVCATLEHASQSPSEPWVLRPGRHETLRTESLDRLWGEVVTPAGDPAVAARVTFRASGPKDERDPGALLPLATRSTTTDADGQFVVAWIRRPPCGPCEDVQGGCAELPPMVAAVDVIASAPGHASGKVSFEVEAPPSTSPDAPLRVTLVAAADLLTGQLLGSDGEPYARAYVLARSLERDREQRRAEVDADGNFEVDGLGPGRYSVRALQDGVELATAEAEAGEDLELTGVAEAAGPDVEVIVYGPDGRYAVGATVDGGPFRGAKTDMKGRVRATRALPGSVTLRVRLGPAVARTNVEIPGVSAEGTAHPHRVEVRVEPKDAPQRRQPGL